MTLDQAANQETFIVKDINQNPKMKKRLQDMGLTKGARIKVLSNNTGGSFILNVRGSRVALGKRITESIKVECLHDRVHGLKTVVQTG